MASGQMKMVMQKGSRIVARTLPVLFFLLFAMLPDGEFVIAGSENSFATSDLRGIYISPAKNKDDTRVIGRLGIYYLQHGLASQVGFAHPFQNGDQFRLEISSNRSGWFYVMHRQESDEPKIIWPRIQSDTYLDSNEIMNGLPVMIPPAPLAFRFDEHTGTEYFYVVISHEREVPCLEVVTTDRKVPIAQQQNKLTASFNSGNRIDEIVNFTIRGSRDEASNAIRSEVFYPGARDHDKYIYFSPPKEEEKKMTIIEFQLRHE